MGKFYTANLERGWSDDQVREAVKKCPGGSCATQICRNCGMYWDRMGGDADTAKILNECRLCAVFGAVKDENDP